MNEHKVGDVVWVDLGSSYGWWPGTVAEQFEVGVSKDGKLSIDPEEIKCECGDKCGTKSEGVKFNIHFFDDESKEVYSVSELARLKSYSCSEKEAMIKEGLKKFESNKNPKSLLDYRARQAQFYKDVEMAEVLTDNSTTVAELLAQYEVVEEGSNAIPDEPPAKKRRKGGRRRKR